MTPAAWPTYESYKDSGVEWIGAVPHDWHLKRLKHITHQISDKVSSKDSLLRYIGMENVESWSGNLVDSASEVEGLASKFAAGDVIFGKLRPYLAKAAKLSFSGICSTEFVVMRAEEEIDPDFLAYLLRSSDFVNFIDSSTYGSKMPRANPSFIANCPVAFPPEHEQRAIAAFLDEKCAKVDEAVRIKEEQIALLRERRQILIQQAVTRGLNPAAPMKDSGIDWIGQIPAHWDQLANKHIFKLRKTLVGKRSSEYELLSLTLRGIIKRDMENPEGKFPAEFDTYQEVSPGDFVFCHFDVEETPRTVGLSEFFGMITGAYTVYSVADAVDPRFLLHFYICADTDKKMRSLYKGLRNTIPKEAFGTFKTPLPPIEEQREIVAHIDDASRKIEDAIAIKEEQIAALKEYKTSLINAAVTGKIKVA